MKFNRLHKLLSESPIVDFEHHPYDAPETYPNDRHRFSKADKAYLKDPEKYKSFKDSFKNYDFNMYFAEQALFFSGNGPKIMNLADVQFERFSNEMYSMKKKLVSVMNKSNITCVFRGNEAQAPMPINPWQQAHRIGHLLASTNSSRFDKALFYNVCYEFQKVFIKVILKKYPEFKDLNLNNLHYEAFVRVVDEYGDLLYPMMASLGSFKSARQKNVRNAFEFAFEMIAQFLITGKVTLNYSEHPEMKKDFMIAEQNINNTLKKLFDSLKGLMLYVAF